jgi:ABC-type molybdate transport system substrate-binding protein
VPLAAAVHVNAALPDAARALIDLLATPRAHAIIEKAGMLPGG